MEILNSKQEGFVPIDARNIVCQTFGRVQIKVIMLYYQDFNNSVTIEEFSSRPRKLALYSYDVGRRRFRLQTSDFKCWNLVNVFAYIV